MHFSGLLPSRSKGHYRVGRMRFTVMAVTTRNENADTMIASAFNVASLRSRPMQKYLWAIIVFLLQGLVICGVAWVFSALFGYPGGRYQGHGAGLFGALVAVLVLGCIKGAVTRWRAASVRVCPGTSSGITKFSEHEAD
jgi:hypothetical protein